MDTEIDFEDFDFRLYIYVFGSDFHKTYFGSEYGTLLQFWEENDSVVCHVIVTRFGKFICSLNDLSELKDFSVNYNKFDFYEV